MRFPGVEALRSDLDRIDQALDAFDAPIVEDRPGLRWMRDVLSARREHVRESLRDAETTALIVSLEAPPSTRWTVPLVTRLTSVLQQAIHAAARVSDGDADDAELVVRTMSADGASLRVVLERPEGPLEALRVDRDGRPRIDAAVDALVAALEDPAEEEADAIQALAELVVSSGVVATLEARCIDQEPRTAVLDQAAAARLKG